MSELAACRMCLAVDARMYAIADTPLQDVYERITDIPLQNGDNRPKKVCYLCHHLLRKNQAFTEKCVKADELLRLALDSGIELTDAYIRLMDTSDVCSSLCVARPEFIDIVSKATDLVVKEDASLEALVKDELPDLKEETERLEHSELCQNEDQSIRALEAQINTMLMNTSGYTRDEEETLDMGNAAAPCDDERNNPISRIGLTSGRPEKTKNGRTTQKQSTQNNALDEANESIFTECISDVKQESECSTDVERSDATPQSQQENYSKLHSLLGPNASPKLTPKKNLFCEKCGLDFKSLRLYNNHRKISHTTSLICAHCGKVFDNKPSLILHVRAHMQGDNMLLHNSGYSNVLNKQRVKKHAAEKQYICEYCNAGFSHKRSLVRHLRKHDEEKPYRCKHCNEAFTQKVNLKEHILIHTGENRIDAVIATKLSQGNII